MHSISGDILSVSKVLIDVKGAKVVCKIVN
jgi:hypothetical protein